MVEDNSFSLVRGYCFSFKDDENHIRAWFSTISGKEEIFVNDELVASQRKFSRNSVNSFIMNEDVYSISLNTENIFTGPYICTLTKNNKPYKRKKLICREECEKKNKLSYVTGLIPYLVLGLLVGVVGSYYHLSDTVTIGITVGIVIIISIYNYKTDNYNCQKPKIVEEEIV